FKLNRFAVLTLAGTCLSLTACSSSQTRDTTTAPESQSYAVIAGEQAPVPQIQMGDPETINAIINEGKNNSQVLATLTEMCETYGPRLTGSTSLEQSQRWARDLFESYGLSNAHLHKWGEVETRFDRGPSTGRVLMQTSRRRNAEPREVRSMEFTTLAWAPGTNGAEQGHTMFLPTTLDEYESNQGKYEDAWILIQPNYGGRGGIRSPGFLMRERMDQRHEIRNNIDEIINPAPAENAQADPYAWEGSFDYHGSQVPATLTLDMDSDEPTGSMSIQNFSEGPISDIQKNGNNVTFQWKHDMGTSNIELTFDGNNATGVSRAASGNEFALEFTQATKAAAEQEQTEEDTQKLVL
ncbi:MAG: hypothetical protein ACF8LL_12825, partial [Phycisphaerales bacterium]